VELFKKIVAEGGRKGLASIKLNYLGEPLMHPQVIEMVRFAKEQGITEVMFNTNGVLLSAETSAELLEAGIDSLFISFDSADKARYEEIRKGATFEKVLANVKNFYDLRNRDPRYRHVQIRVSKVVFFNEDRHDDLQAFIDLWRDKADAIGFCSCLDLANPSKAEESSIPLCCDQPWQRMLIREDGKAYPCCSDSIYEYCIGDANIQTIEEMWNGPENTKLREAHLGGKYREIDACRKCAYLPVSKVILD
jgi:radical SAM protein with 4Fe4S-binding SPASM domain